MSIRAKLAALIGGKAPPAQRSFVAAQFNRLNADWVMAWARSADGDLRYELRTLRNRARELLRNSPFGARYHQLLAENVIGPAGIGFQARNKTKDGTLYDAANAAIEAAWEDSGKIGNWDLEQRLTRNEQFALAVSNWGNDGEILIRKYRGRRFGPYGFMAQALDPDFLDDLYNQERTNNLPLIRQGVEFDEFGAPQAYWLWTRHPFDPSFDRQRVRIPADEIVHAFIPLRPGQSRGIPHGAAVMTTLKMLDGYIEAELVAARTASAKMGALVDSDPTMPNGRSPTAGGQDIPAEADPGSLLDLRGTGTKLELWDPQHPSGNFDPFANRMAHYVAMGWGLSYATLTGDVSQSNYSSTKVGQQPERDHFRRLQSFIIDHVVDRLYRDWLAMALLNGKIPGITDFNVERWTNVVWQPRGWQSPDPLKDAQASLIMVAAATETLTNIAAQDGRDLEEIAEERQSEIKMLKSYGVESVLPIAKPKGTSDSTSGDTPSTTDVSGEAPNGNGKMPPGRIRFTTLNGSG